MTSGQNSTEFFLHRTLNFTFWQTGFLGVNYAHNFKEIEKMVNIKKQIKISN